MINLPKHKCGLFITHNRHKNYYQVAADFIEEQKHQECPGQWENEEMKQKSIETDEVWTLQWYPDNPTSCEDICAPTLEDLLRFAQEVPKE